MTIDKHDTTELELMPRVEIPPLESTVRLPSVAPTPSDLLAMAVSRGADMEQLRQLMDLQERYEANIARKAYVAAMAAFKSEPMEILKRKLVTFQTRDGETTSYHHAELSDVTDTVVPAMGKHGLSHRWGIAQKGSEITVTCEITHELGHFESVAMTAMPDASGKKNAIQQVASTVSYLQRYTLLALTGMATKGMDDDGRSGGSAAGDDDPGEDVMLADWENALRGCGTTSELANMRKEMIQRLGAGDINKVPSRLRTVAMERASALATQ